MTESGFSASDAVLTNAMSGGFNRGGSGSWGGGGYGTAPFASPGSNAVRIESGNKTTAAGIENLLDQNQFSATNKNIVDGDARVCDTLRSNANRSADQSFQSELRSGDRLRDLERMIGANAAIAAQCCCDTQKEIALAAKDAAKCCCDAQLSALEKHGEILLKMADDKNDLATQMATGFAAVKDRELNSANARITQLETINALRAS